LTGWQILQASNGGFSRSDPRLRTGLAPRETLLRLRLASSVRGILLFSSFCSALSGDAHL
jgi:hypothetical protein